MIAITEQPLDLDALIGAVRTDACGAVAAFLGVVRQISDDERPVDGLSYEAYPAMAVPEMERIADEARERFGTCTIAVVHRIGALKLGEASVAIAVGSAHRAAAFDACEYVIDELKRRVPVWKKEHYTGGEATWRENARA
jgi:molybdopterin synthase catalytic subunit